MSSRTLRHILEHWLHPVTELPTTDRHELPFNLESFCRENDEKLAHAESLCAFYKDATEKNAEAGTKYIDLALKLARTEENLAEYIKMLEQRSLQLVLTEKALERCKEQRDGHARYAIPSECGLPADDESVLASSKADDAELDAIQKGEK